VDIAKKMWQDIKAVKPTITISPKIIIETDSYPIEEDFVDENMHDYWLPICQTCQDIFLDALAKAHKNNQVESFAKEYAGFLGQDDREADMRWVLACPVLTVQRRYFLKYFRIPTPVPKHTKRKILKEEFKIFSLAFTRAIVEKSLDSKDYYLRVHHFAMWWGVEGVTIIDFMDIDHQKISEGRLMENDFAYWYAIRRLLSVAYICDCEDILIKTKNAMNNKNISEAYKLIFNRVRLLSSPVEYDKITLRFGDPSFELPHITRPDFPFPDTAFSDKKSEKSLPRISRRLLQYGSFVELFEDRITKIVEEK
jgi:hypothetical protein